MLHEEQINRGGGAVYGTQLGGVTVTEPGCQGCCQGGPLSR